MRWYVVHAYSGMEKAVERNLRERIERAGMQDKFGRILVPTEEVVELKNGKKAVTERRFFPGYVLVEMEMDDESWHLVKHTSKVTGFVGGARNRPAPISEAEVMKIVNQMQEGVEKPRPKVEWKWASWCASRKARSPTSTVRSKKSTTRRARCASRSPSSAAPRRSSWTSRRSRRSDKPTGRRTASPTRRKKVFAAGALSPGSFQPGLSEEPRGTPGRSV
jgi:transcription termination/antitermination factor NusG